MLYFADFSLSLNQVLMHFLLLAIASSVSILLIFKHTSAKKIRSLEIILINYIVAVLAGMVISARNIIPVLQASTAFIWPAVVIGILFIVNFFIMSETTKRSGIMVTAISGRMAVIIPILFSALYYGEKINSYKSIGILLALVAIVLSMIKKNGNRTSGLLFLLPVLLFIMTGLTDSSVKFTQAAFLNDSNLPVFSTLLFAVAGLSGVLFYMIRGGKFGVLFTPSNIWWGVLLGLSNLGSILFFVSALTHSGLDSSVVYGINHISVISLSVVAGWLLFREKLSAINLAGLLVALVAILLLYHS